MRDYGRCQGIGYHLYTWCTHPISISQKKKSQNLNSIKSTWITIYKLVTISHTHTHTQVTSY